MRKNRVKITILYKNGKFVNFTCDSFEVRHEGDRIVHLTWSNAIPHPLYIGMADIVSIWQHGGLPKKVVV